MHLVVLPAKSEHHHSQELLEGALSVDSESISQAGGDDDGQTVSQTLYRVKKKKTIKWLSCCILDKKTKKVHSASRKTAF